ncbi:MAG: cytochrome-c peroxidase [Bacteroidota bacterium]|nr:cytochrome-c peroxidase [Bacteroidota bacterium]
MSPLNKNKKFLFGLVMACALLVLVISAFTEKKNPANETRSYCLENIKLFQAQLDTFQNLAQQNSGKKLLIGRFKKMRIDFKRFEFIAEYLDNQRYIFFNGVNAVEMEDGFNPNAKPEGLQVIETELYNDSLDIDRIVFLTKQLKYRTLSFYLLLKDAPMRDTYIFEAIRFQLIRIETLSLVSFDSPKLRNNTAEISATLQALNTILDFYKNEKITEDLTILKTKISSAIVYLTNKNFNSLDRIYFIKNYIQPLTKSISDIQQKLSIKYLEETNELFRAVNLKAKTIYDVNFLNVKYYAQDKYHKDNPQYIQLGKRLFFDKRLSADASMSCANCHQPSNCFTDNLPTAITNVAGEFQKRNTPTILNAALQAGYFYDLAATSLETQVDHVMVNPHEFNGSYEQVIGRLKADTTYTRMFAEAFPEYKSDAVSSFGINTCIADFERQFIKLNSPFDQYIRGEKADIDPGVKRGFNLFMGKAQCGSCHFAPTFFSTAPPFYGASESEVLGTIKTFDTIHPMLDEDIGRFKNIEYDLFKHAFKTSTVRNAELTAPYMHNGGFKTLDEVIEFYNRGGGAGLGLNVPNQTLPPDKLNLTKQDKKDIILFIKALTDTSGISNFTFGISN